MLEIKNVWKTFNKGTVNEKQALCGVNLTLNDGDFCTVIGGNGAGKSTTLNAIAGVWPVDCGQILIDGKDISALPEHKRAPYLGRVFQDPMTGTVADMEIIENLAIAARRGKKRGLSWGVKADERFRYRQMLAEFDLGLEDRMSSKVGLLSGGQRQAITLLMATIKKPKLLLLDEHTAALDPKTAAKVLELSDKIIAENNLTALMVTHNMHDAITHGNRLIMMSDGKIILDISGEEKKNLTVEHLLEMFEKASGSKLENDRMLLSKQNHIISNKMPDTAVGHFYLYIKLCTVTRSCVRRTAVTQRRKIFRQTDFTMLLYNIQILNFQQNNIIKFVTHGITIS